MTTQFLTDDALKEHIQLLAGDENAEVLIMDGFAPAAIGVHWSGDQLRVVYSMNRVLQVLEREHGLSSEDAVEHYDYNIERALAYLGPLAPVIIEEF